VNTYLKQGYSPDSKFLKEISDGLHDEIFTVKAIQEALNLVS
jgi:hypothetical protein